ncbi:hypothetical protein [Mycobacteroides franklinii]|uniref:hypothetical protein n=1 Tax=Mycobacteroides franklinii TaxID=948102 RepID=UPI0013E8BC3A|nr:hypothetical protein [Mycobacteroides franklinii]
MEINRLRILRALRLKGRIPGNEVPGAVGMSESDAAELVQELAVNGHIEEVRGRFKLSIRGREHLDEQLALERQTLDEARIIGLYEEFDAHNSALKSLMTRWQLKADDTPNDHNDADYDQAVINDLAAVDVGFQPLLTRMIETAPRLGHYPERLSGALERITAGDHSWFAKPLADSYHTVWFELHEDLIGLAGLSRAEEAAAGRAE